MIRIVDAASGLDAVIAIDDDTLGPAAGGVRTRAYASEAAAQADAQALARAMTIKCALAGLDAGGGKCVVRDHAGLDRPRAFRVLGAAIEDLRGAFRTAGDLGTRAEDLAAMAETTRYVHTDERGLAAAVARGLAGCIGALGPIEGARVAVQGAGAIGAAVVRELVARGAHVVVADLDRAKAEATGARVIDPSALFDQDVDVLAPCAIGGVIDEAIASHLRARAVCGAANNVFHGELAARVLHDRGVLVVPDVLASAGAVIDGIGASVMHLGDRTPLIDALAATAADLLRESRATDRTTTELAIARARARITAARNARG
jgi:leucine dehydrogenase